jgi:WD40 repeat protein
VAKALLALTADGEWALRNEVPRQLDLVNITRGITERTIKTHGEVRAVTVSADGNRALFGSYNGTLEVWNVKSADRERTLNGHVAPVNAVGVTPDCKIAASGCENGIVRVWDLMATESSVLRSHGSPVSAIAVTPDGRWALSGSYADNTLMLWDRNGGLCIETIAPVGVVYSLVLSLDAEIAVLGSMGRVVARNLHTQKRIWEQDWEAGAYGEDLERVISLAFVADNKRILAVSELGTLKIFSIGDGTIEGSFHWEAFGSNPRVWISHDGAIVAAWNLLESDLRVWELDWQRSDFSLPTPSQILHVDPVGGICGIGLLSRPRLAVVMGLDGTEVWNLESGKCERTFEPLVFSPDTVELAVDNMKAVVKGKASDNVLQVWDLGTAQPLGTYIADAPVTAWTGVDKVNRLWCGTADGQVHMLTVRVNSKEKADIF